MRFLTIDDVDLKGKVILLRVDFNVPLKNSEVQDTTRIDRVAPTIESLRDKGAKIVLISHLGQPKGKFDPKLSLKPVAKALSDVLWGYQVTFLPNTHVDEALIEKIKNLQDGDVVLLENIRFRPEEEANDIDYAKELSRLADYYVNDAFSVSHRQHASVDAITRVIPTLVGKLLQEELSTLDMVLKHPERPMMAIVGGSKVSTKLTLLENLIDKVDVLAVAGGIAHTLLMAKGYNMGKSIHETDMVEVADKIFHQATEKNCELILPSDVIITKNIASKEWRRVSVDAIEADDIALDIGSTTVKALKCRIKSSKTLLWNGPLGMFEEKPYDTGTDEVAHYVAHRTEEGKLMSVAGGGDTVAALAQAGCLENFSYVSTAGGAFLQLIEGRPLPGLEALARSGSNGTTCSTKKRRNQG